MVFDRAGIGEVEQVSIDNECNTPVRFPMFEFTYTHKGHTFTGHIGARDWKDAVEKLASARTNARVTGQRVEVIDGGRYDDE